jgi:hypothetical protein
MVIRLPGHMKNWLRQEAAENCTSQNAEVIRAIRQRMESEARAAG